MTTLNTTGPGTLGITPHATILPGHAPWLIAGMPVSPHTGLSPDGDKHTMPSSSISTSLGSPTSFGAGIVEKVAATDTRPDQTKVQSGAGTAKKPKPNLTPAQANDQKYQAMLAVILAAGAATAVSVGALTTVGAEKPERDDASDT